MSHRTSLVVRFGNSELDRPNH